jgi:putative membrane protein
MSRFLIRWFINAVALGVTAYLLPGISFEGDWLTIIIAGLIFGLVNAFLRPLLTLLTCPLIILTLGLFTLVINAILLQFTAWLVPNFHVSGFWSAFWASLVISIISALLSLFIHEEDKGPRDDDVVVIHRHG